MTIPQLHMYDLKTGEYTGSRDATRRPNGEYMLEATGAKVGLIGTVHTEATGATPVALPADIPAGHIARWTGDAWEAVEDHRQHMDERGRKEGGTPYWLPGDTWRSEPRYTEELGPLPTEALLAKPEKSAEELAQEAQAKIKGRLAALDAKYLTPRTLAGLAVGDEYALEQWRAHEAEAETFRIQLAAL